MATTKKTSKKTSATAKKTSAKKPVVKKTVAKKTTTKKAVVKKVNVPKKTTAKKSVAKKPVTKKTVVKKVATKKVSPKKTVVKKVAAKKPAVKKVVKTAVKKSVATKAIAKKTTVKKPTVKKLKIVAKKNNVAKESFNDTLLKKWLVGSNDASLDDKKFAYFKQLIEKFENRDGRFTLSWNLPAALFNFLYSFFRKDYIGGLVLVIILKIVSTLSAMLFIEVGVYYSMLYNFMYLVMLAILSSSVVNYFLYNKFENDKAIIAKISNKDEALKVIKELGGTHEVWKFVMIALTIALFAISIWMNANGLA